MSLPNEIWLPRSGMMCDRVGGASEAGRGSDEGRRADGGSGLCRAESVRETSTQLGERQVRSETRGQAQCD